MNCGLRESGAQFVKSREVRVVSTRIDMEMQTTQDQSEA
jgi:hypothetical protein